MQYQIIKLCIHMIEQEWIRAFGPASQIELYANVYRGTSGYKDRLASAWFVLNLLKAHF